MDPFEIVWWLLQILFEIVGDVLFSGWGELIDVLDGPSGQTVLETLAWFVAGAALGLLSGIVLPHRLLPPPRTAGLSLVASPLISGFAMRAWGSLRRERGHAVSSLATFHGGGAFALGAALGRFVLVA